MKSFTIRYSAENFHTNNEIKEKIYSRLEGSGLILTFVLDKYYPKEKKSEVQYHFEEGVTIPADSELEKILTGFNINNLDLKLGKFISVPKPNSEGEGKKA